MAKPLTFIVYDVSDPKLLEPFKRETQRRYGSKISFDYNKTSEVHNTEFYNENPNTAHGLKVAGFIMESVDEGVLDIPVKVIHVEYPMLISDNAMKLFFKGVKFPLTKETYSRIARFSAHIKILETTVAKYKPDAIISSVGISTSGSVGRRRAFLREEASAAFAKYNRIPYIQAIANEKSLQKLPKGPKTIGPFVLVGGQSGNILPANAQTDPRTLRGAPLAHNRYGFKIPLVTGGFLSVGSKGFLPTGVTDRAERVKGNSFVSPVYGSLIMAAIAQTNTFLKDRYGFTRLTRLLAADFFTNIDKYEAKFPEDNYMRIRGIVSEAKNYVRQQYNLESAAPKTIDTQKQDSRDVSVNTLFNMAPVKQFL